jgi:catechol 2,3-dioxygenase-like lactoylglutathione lyase family enzyme
MPFAQRHAISDVCILCADIERSIRFYVDNLGFRPKHRAESFADFSGAGLTLALWEIDHISRHSPRTRRPQGLRRGPSALAGRGRRLLSRAVREGRALPGAARRLRVERLLLLLHGAR